MWIQKVAAAAGRRSAVSSSCVGAGAALSMSAPPCAKSSSAVLAHQSARLFGTSHHHQQQQQQQQEHQEQPRASTDFGFREVDVNEKERMVREVFSKVAEKYDVMNDLMSFGVHRLWKDDLIRMLGYDAASKVDPHRAPRHLDVAGGTGDVAFRSLKAMLQQYHGLGSRAPSTSSGDDHTKQIVVCDINPEMLAVGRDRVKSQVGEENADLIGFVEGNAEELPFESDSFDLYTIAFGLRNVTNKDKAIREAHRVLRKGGRLLILEFSHVDNQIVRQIYDQFSFNVIPRIGELVANDKESYQYLVESIRNFPRQETLRSMVAAEGFSFCTYTDYTFGVVSIHSGFKI